MTYIRNTWYVAGWDSDVCAGDVVSRRILDVPLVFFRDDDGLVVALHDMCPHRFAPLSKGKLNGGSIVCGYHGLAFDRHGKCSDNPHGPIVPALCVQDYPVVERHRALWIWMGDRDKANRELIPDLGFIDEKPEAFGTGYLNIPADYRLMVENILDLSHTDYLHPDTLGGVITGAKTIVTEDEDSVSIQWKSESQNLPPTLLAPYQAIYPNNDPVGDLNAIVRWYPPSILAQDTRFGPPGTVEDPPIKGLMTHIFTPESEGKTHYFYSVVDDFIAADPSMKEVIIGGLGAVFATEDSPMLAGQYERMNGRDFWDMKPVLLSIDRAPTKVRRRIDELVKAEAVSV